MSAPATRTEPSLSPQDWIERHVYTPYSGRGYFVMMGINLLLFGPIGLAGGGGIAISGAGAAVLMAFMLEPVVAWWAGTWGARDVVLFNDVDEEGLAPESVEDDVAGDEDGAEAAFSWPGAPATRVQQAIGRAATWARSAPR